MNVVGKSYLVNRELSWLKFNERVLEEAENPANPLCERLSFMSIFGSNLDEFFMVRIGALKDQIGLGIRDSKTGMTPREQIDAALEAVARLNRRKDKAYARLMEAVAAAGVSLVNFRALSAEESARLEKYFDAEMLPLLAPSIIGRRQPFPFLPNKDIYATVVLRSRSGKKKMGLIPCGTGVFPRLIRISDRQYMLSEELILHFIYKVFEGYTVQAKSLVRVTRSADIDADVLYDEDLDYREFMAGLIKERRKLEPVRVELSRALDDDSLELLCSLIGVEAKAVYRLKSPLSCSFVSEIQDVLRQHAAYFYPRRMPQRTSRFRPGVPLLAQVAEGDKLLAYPFQSMNPFLNLLREAAADKDVTAIRMTLYRVARQSEVVSALIDAAENGKDVLVLVELKARFDEENNIEWSRRLEAAGCHVIYGLQGYKVHSKLCLITRRTDGGEQYITQVGTGNYNEKTARMYTDFSLMTANEAIGRDALTVFDALVRGETVQESSLLLVAPNCLQSRVLAMMDEEIAHAQAGEEAYIGVKVNALTDKTLIEKLVEASQAGVKIDMVVRGICCLLPGVEGKTENIRVISIVGRFLEHSRIYIFGTAQREKLYISSADFMTRNTLRRVEVAVPVLDDALRAKIHAMFDVMLRDNVQARQLQSDGTYERVPARGELINSQELFCQQASEEADG